MADSRALLQSLFDADRALRTAEEALLSSGDERSLAKLVAEETRIALGLSDRLEQELRLIRLADLCAQVQSAESVDALLSILDFDEPSVRAEAGEALLEVAYERYKEVALGIERLLKAKHEGPAMEELPFVLIEVHEPDPLPLVSRFLAHPRAETVAAGIEALAMYGNPAAVRYLRELTNDAREVTLPELDDSRTTIGDLAADAIEQLEGDSGDDDA